MSNEPVLRISRERKLKGKVFRDSKSGDTYTVIGLAEVQAPDAAPLTDYELTVVYRDVGGDLRVRRVSEFIDGRFEEVGPAQTVETKRVYIKALRTLVAIQASYADQIRDLLNTGQGQSSADNNSRYTKAVARGLAWRERAERLEAAMKLAVEKLGAWLTDNTEEAFEEQPEIDGVRTDLDDAINLP